MEYYKVEDKPMRHDSSEVIAAFKYLQNTNKSPEYQSNFNVIGEYIEDLTALVTYFKKAAEDSTDLLIQVNQKIAEFNQPDPEKLYIEKIQKATKALEKLKKGG